MPDLPALTATHVLIFVTFLQVLDIGTTLVGILKYGAYEKNGWMARLFAFAGDKWPYVLVALKAAFVGLLWWQRAAIPMWAFLVIAALYLAVLANNIRVIDEIRERQ